MILGQPFVHLMGQPLALEKRDSRLRHNKLAVGKTDDTASLSQFVIGSYGHLAGREGNPRVSHVMVSIGRVADKSRWLDGLFLRDVLRDET
jgi:hypothetical protein